MIPNLLYHYTSFETLKLILKNNSFRFTRLDKLNDPMEGYLLKYENYRENIFVSSWSAVAKEQIPMWKIYSNDFKGVRIGMPVNLFNFNDDMLIRTFGYPKKFLASSKLDKSYSIIKSFNEDKSNSNIVLEEISKVFGPCQVNYKSNLRKLNENVIKNVSDKNGIISVTINFYELGQQKISDWKYEREYRYLIFYNNIVATSARDDVFNGNYENHKIETEFLDVNFNENALNGIEVIMGPNSSEKEIEEINQILKSKKLWSYTIKKSDISIKL